MASRFRMERAGQMEGHCQIRVMVQKIKIDDDDDDGEDGRSEREDGR